MVRTSFSYSTNSKRDGNRSEHALVHGKQQIGNLSRSHGGSCENISEANVVQVAEELAGTVGEGERVTPEEPLEGDHGCGHDGEPDERQGGLSPCQTGIEEARERISFCVV